MDRIRALQIAQNTLQLQNQIRMLCPPDKAKQHLQECINEAQESPNLTYTAALEFRVDRLKRGTCAFIYPPMEPSDQCLIF